MRRSLPAAAVLALALLVSAVPAASAQTGSSDYQQVVDITFPTDRRATYIDDYDQPRSGGRRHQATDLMGEKMWLVHAAVGGTITWIPGADGSPMPSYGYMIRITGDDGRTYSYVHLNNDTPGTDDGRGGPQHAYAPGLRQGSRVERGQHIGYLGDSGNAEQTPPHLHFEISDPAVRDPYGGTRINPYRSLRAAEARGDYADTRVQGAPVDRVFGRNRVETAVSLSTEAFDSAAAVVVTHAGSFPDAIVAGPLAAALEAPVLTTFGTSLEPQVLEEIRRLGATSAYVVGPRSRISAQVERDIVNGTEVAPSDLHRLAGADDFETAEVVARSVQRMTGSTAVLVALGDHPEPNRAWPDALTAGYAGALRGRPVLLVAHDRVPEATLRALEGATAATIVGGTAAIAAEHEAAIRQRVPATDRISGRDRFTTAGAVADGLLADGLVAPDRLWVATGHGYADALAAAGALAAEEALFVLVDGSDRGGDNGLASWFERHAPSIGSGRAIGGTAVVSAAALERLSQRIR
jgi:putative cell wall-binding protein